MADSDYLTLPDDFMALDDDDPTQVDSCSLERLSASLPARPTSDSTLLADHTTFRIGGPARKLVRAESRDELIEAVRDADAAGEPLLVLSGGSNVVVADEGFDGTVVLVDSHGVEADVSACGGALVQVQAGEVWDDLVSYSIDQEWVGAEALSGIPGLVGAAPIQNIGAYGQDASQTIARVRTWDRATGELHTFVADKCGFGYRDSVFKRSRVGAAPTGRYVVLDVWFHFPLGSLSEPIRYAQLAAALGVRVGERVPAVQVRQAVQELRSSKGMVLDPDDRDTWSAGSFFMNPIVDAEIADRLPEEAPRFAQPDGRVKTSAAWLIDQTGFAKGYPGSGVARLSSKHVLALTNHDGASAADIVELARTVRGGVDQRFGIRLEPEPVLVGLEI